MKIAMLSYHTCPRSSQEGKETGGMNVYVLELSRALARKGHVVDIFTRSHEVNDPLCIVEEERLRVLHIPAGPQEPLPKKQLLAYIPEFIEHAGAFVRDEKGTYDCMHAHYYQSGLIALNVRSLYHIPFVMSFHTLALMKNLVARDTLERESRGRIAIEKRLAKSADAIIASSENDKSYTEYLYDADPNRVFVAYPGINPELFYEMPKATARAHIHADAAHTILLFVGRVEPLKGIDTLLYAMKILKKQSPDKKICLWIVGGDTSEEQSRWPKTLRALATLRKTLDIPEECVHFAGRQPQTELPYYYNAADAVVMPSHYESFGMSAQEAIACNVPVITTNVAGISARVSHVTSANNPLLLAQTISNVLSQPRTNAHAFVPGSWNDTASIVEGVYKTLM